ncbi:EpsG family protein [Candidatus Hamiltonella endosymbiont of Tuberolachnus salignus]|uniref:EpsG family protein n=1 Tax=Candidatus Williamhamiltonella endosymbiont of Tuberolachnus salignus TaxID=3077954 RepID=UPI003BAEA6AF
MISEYSPIFLLNLSLIYLLIAVFCAIIKNNSFSIFVSLLLIIIYVTLFGLRDYSIGSDTRDYVENFLYNNNNFEPLFVVITSLIQLITSNPTAYLLILSLIYGVNIFFAYIIFGKNVKSHITIFIWFLLFSLTPLLGIINYFRQPISISFFLLGLAVYLNKKKINFLSGFLFIFSTLIHYSNIIFLLLLVFSRFINLKAIFFIFIIALLLFLDDFGLFIINKYGDYHIVQKTLAKHIHLNAKRSISTIHMYIFLYFSHLLIFLYFYKYRINNKIYTDLLKLYVLILSVSVFLSFNREIAIRIYVPLQYILPILYMHIYTHIKQKLTFSLLFISYGLFYFCYILNRPWFTDQFSGNIN